MKPSTSKKSGPRPAKQGQAPSQPGRGSTPSPAGRGRCARCKAPLGAGSARRVYCSRLCQNRAYRMRAVLKTMGFTALETIVAREKKVSPAFARAFEAEMARLGALSTDRDKK